MTPLLPMTPLLLLAWICFGCALMPAALFCWNLFLYRAPRRLGGLVPGPISVLIPARDEEQSIAAAVESVLASTHVALELIVLDDASTDRTARIVRDISAWDSRVRLETAPPLPAGWNGKQHACAALAALAKYDVLCFLDADVRVAPLALASMESFLNESRSDLVSGFPRQETETPLEWLLLPLIHFVLLGFLPLAMMRRSGSPGFAAGCGQFLMVRRAAYERSGTHAAMRATMHDGIMLPRLLREHGFRTDIADLTNLATCRMYRNAGEVWRGLAKNATEGLAAPARIVPFTLLLGCGQVLPVVLTSAALAGYQPTALVVALAALALAYLPRLLAAARFQQTALGAALHPAGVALLLALQWWALLRKAFGVKASWKQRAYEVG